MTKQQIFSAIKNEVLLLHFRWDTYEKIYGKSADRIALLNLSAPSFFHHLQFIILDDVELIISKLLDTAKTQGNKNLSLEQLIFQFGDLGEDITDELSSRLYNIRERAKDIRTRRNKRLSHFDLKASVSRDKEIFTKASRKAIKEILSDFSDYLNIIDSRIYNTTTIYNLASAPGDAESLINCLKRSASYKELEKENVFEHGFWRTKGPFHDS